MAKVIHFNDPRKGKYDELRYTKHYYIGSERVGARTGSLPTLGYYPTPYLSTEFGQLVTTYGVKTKTTAAQTARALPYVNKVFNKFGAIAPILGAVTSNNLGPTHNIEPDTYFFHPDHLGSSSYISTLVSTGFGLNRGVVTQHMEYLPFGEAMMDEHINSNNSPIKYNGKEFDEETGNYYYGARYYDPKLSNFISVDPLVEKTMSSYGYCYNNSVRFTDPTGMESDDIIFTNKNNEEIGRIIAPGKDHYVKVDTDFKPSEPIIVDPTKMAADLGMERPDAIGLSTEYAGVVGGGIVGGFDFVLMTNGKEAGSLYGYKKIGGGVGVDAELGAAATISYFNNEADSNLFNAAGMEGKSSGYSGGFLFSGGYSWGNEKNVSELYLGQKSTTTWETYSFGGFGGDFGAKFLRLVVN